MGSVINSLNLLKVSMTETDLGQILSENIKKYRKGIFTQESLAEKTELSVQLINGIEGGRKWVSRDSLTKIANALNIEVYQLFIPKNHNPIKIEETPQNQNIYNQIQKQVIEDVRKSITRTLDKWEKEV